MNAADDDDTVNLRYFEQILFQNPSFEQEVVGK